MTKNELFDILDIEDGSEFTFFENLADLLEYDGEISPEALIALLSEVDMEVFPELVENYFDDLAEHLPDTDVDFHNILEAEKRTLISLAGSSGSGDGSSLRRLNEELGRFREWYSLTENCVCNYDETGESIKMTIRDAAAHYRLSKLDGTSVSLDFSDALDFEVEDYIVSFDELAESGYTAEG